MNLIIPCAGESSRFPDTRPKWMLTQPDGKLMVVSSLGGLQLNNVENIYVVVLRKHLEQYQCEDGIKEAFADAGFGEKLNLVILDEVTESQPETIAKAIEIANVSGSIFIKDCDGCFRAEVKPVNEVCVYDLSKMNLVHAANKSYVICDEHGLVSNIAEKNIISSTFCVGGYAFEDAKVFLNYFNKMKHLPNLYVSHLIYQMMLDNHTFGVQGVDEYVDWGTLSEWTLYKQEYATLFIDIDGVLVENSGQYFSPRWGETSAITENVKAINSMFDSGKTQVILTTARKDSFKKQTEKQLENAGVKYHQIIYGLLHCKRIIVNDYSKTNPYKSCDAINLKRNSAELGEMLRDCVKSYK